MLPKINRLTKKRDFDLVFRMGKSDKSGFLAVRVLENNLPQSRFGFVVGKRISRKATIRNKIKRRLRALIRGEEIKKPADFVIIALPGAEKADFSATRRTISNLVKRYK